MKISIIILIILLLIVGIETMIYFKKNENKRVDDIKKSLLIRIDILMVLTVAIGVLTIINIIKR